MPFTQTAVISVNPPTFSGGDLRVSWIGTLPAGQVWQVYIARELQWHDTTNKCRIPYPHDAVRIDVGSVDAAEGSTSFASSLPPSPANRVELSWLGGTFLNPTGDVAGFHVYAETAPGSGLAYSSPTATIPCYIGGVVTDGFGLGGFGSGGFGQIPGHYSWASDALYSGTWAFAVAAYDRAGNEGPIAVVSAVLEVPPRPPAYDVGTLIRLHYAVVGYGAPDFGDGGFGSPLVELTWNESPG